MSGKDKTTEYSQAMTGGSIFKAIVFCRTCRHFGIDGKPYCSKFGFYDERMEDGKGFCYWGERV